VAESVDNAIGFPVIATFVITLVGCVWSDTEVIEAHQEYSRTCFSVVLTVNYTIL
jgi:hypothetical protein